MPFNINNTSNANTDLNGLIEYVNEVVENYDNLDELEKEQIKQFVLIEMKKYINVKIGSKLLGQLFILISKPDDDGYSEEVRIDYLVENVNAYFKTTNGSSWNRTNQSFLGKKYNIQRGHEKGSISSVKLEGINKHNTIDQAIRADIQSEIKKQRCAILFISENIECDHKDGLKDDGRVGNLETQSIDDFQPLCKTANMAKKSHCKKCKDTHKRFDAKQLGYSFGFTKGDENSPDCKGCYWYDPRAFNKAISKDYKKSR